MHESNLSTTSGHMSGENANSGGTNVQSLAIPMSAEPPQARAPAVSERAPEAAVQWEALVARMRENDTVAFETALKLTRDAAWRLASHMLGDAHLAQDVLQDAYVVVFT